MEHGEGLESVATPRPKQVSRVDPFIDTPRETRRNPEASKSSKLIAASKDTQEPKASSEDVFQREADSEDIDVSFIP